MPISPQRLKSQLNCDQAEIDSKPIPSRHSKNYGGKESLFGIFAFDNEKSILKSKATLYKQIGMTTRF